MQSLIMRLDTQRSLCQPLWMARPIGERIKKLRNEIAEISEANRVYLQGGKKAVAAADDQRRLERLQAILDELMSLTDWKKT